MDTAEEERNRKREQRDSAMQIRAAIEGLKNLPFIPADVKQKINEELPTFLPVIKEEVKAQLYKLSQSLNMGAEARTYTLSNRKNGPTVIKWKGLVVTEGIKEKVYPLDQIVKNIDTYTSIEALIADILTLRILDPTDKAEVKTIT